MTTLRPALVLMCGLACLSAGAQAQDRPRADLVRTHFTVDAGLPASVINQIAQTPDGFLWMVTGAGDLVRFDGRRFQLFTISQTFGVAVASNGDLLVGTRPGLLRVPSSRLHHSSFADLKPYHPDPANRRDLICLRLGRGGLVWIGTSGGLYRYDGTHAVAVGPRVPILGVDEDAEGRAWIVTGDGVFEIAGTDVVSHAGLPAQLGVERNEIFHLLKDRAGRTWYSTAKGIARESAGRVETIGPYGGERDGAFLSYEAPDGRLWISKHEGLFRAGEDGLDPVAPGMQVRAVHADAEGNLWVGTNGDGLHRFSVPAVRMYGAADGLPDSPIMTVITARDGTIWAGANCGGLSRFDGQRFQTLNEKHGLANSCVFSIAEDRNGDLWIGTWGGGAFHYRQGRFMPLTTKEGMPHDRVTSIVAARDGAVWFSTSAGLARLKDGQLRTFKTTEGLSRNAVFRVYEDRAGVIWAAGRLGLDRLVGERFEHYAGLANSMMIPMGEDRDGGFFVYDSDKTVVRRIARQGITSYDHMAGPAYMLETDRGELWFGGNVITRMPPGQFAQPRAQDEPFDYEAFSTADGLATAEVSVTGQRTLAIAHDGAVWAATLKGLARFDRAGLTEPTKKPQIYLTEITIGRNTVPAPTGIVLPPGTSHLRVSFSVVELSSPEKIRMQYRLEGVDSEWLDAGRDPQAIYSTLPPGRHTLRIRATDRRGVWDRDGVSFTVVQQPFFYQTRTFAALVILAGGLVVFGLHRLRVRKVSRDMSARFDERLAERTRVARELHDTFLQTVQGSKMVADHAIKNSDDHARMVRAMEQLATWLDQATHEGRAALNSLRASTTEKNDLAGGFRRAMDECRQAGGAEMSLAVHGEARELHPVVRDEVYRIGYEALRNACTHSRASRIELELRYAEDLVVRITDNGVGMEPALSSGGKEGHFGLQGMRERADRIGARLTLVSSPGSGTEVELLVPASTIFMKPGARRPRGLGAYSS